MNAGLECVAELFTMEFILCQWICTFHLSQKIDTSVYSGIDVFMDLCNKHRADRIMQRLRRRRRNQEFFFSNMIPLSSWDVLVDTRFLNEAR